MIELTLRYGFPAAHILCQPALSDEENWAIYDKCANPNGHGHNYEVEVTVTGPIEARTGRILAPELLDRIFEERIEARFARRLLNDDEAFRDRVPTAENIALVIHETLADEVARRSSAEVTRVKVVETRHNSCSTGAIA
ncbi:MAG: 6-carboxytetrahydropterin synthase [Deltaproteobacteria bacterium]|nr:6-carboxytetrahydropterin synthase [Deltaproteobacteria bacterium]